jgi:hypothetical protein
MLGTLRPQWFGTKCKLSAPGILLISVTAVITASIFKEYAINVSERRHSENTFNPNFSTV